MTFRQWMVELFKDERGSISVKPLVALIGTLFLCSVLLINTIKGANYKPANELINVVMVITSIGLGADTLDKFSYKGEKPKVESSEETTN